MSDLIKRSDAIKAIEDKVNGSENRLWLKEIVSEIPSADIPHSDDWERYSDKLWKIAYERGKADRLQGHYIKGENGEWYCSECRRIDDKYSVARYCWYCGCRMKGADDNE